MSWAIVVCLVVVCLLACLACFPLLSFSFLCLVASLLVLSFSFLSFFIFFQFDFLLLRSWVIKFESLWLLPMVFLFFPKPAHVFQKVCLIILYYSRIFSWKEWQSQSVWCHSFNKVQEAAWRFIVLNPINPRPDPQEALDNHICSCWQVPPHTSEWTLQNLMYFNEMIKPIER